VHEQTVGAPRVFHLQPSRIIMSALHHRQRRREFLVGAAASVVTASFGLAGKTAGATTMETSKTAEGEHRILSLRLLTAAPLDEMRDYYRKVIGLEIANESETEFEIRAGQSRITFVKADPSQGKPFYHFAFNIPENKVLAAHDWQAERGPLMPTPRFMQDRKFPTTVRHFRNWDAHSVFFWDPAGNILEYIGRHTLKNGADGPFTQDDILYASEIAFIADDVPAMGDAIKMKFSLPQYLQGSAGFQAIGDEHGLLLVFKRGRTSGAAIKDPQKFDVFPVDATIRSDKSLAVPDFPYGINRAS
jgi:hypothetical protein